jgi:hypothetical protein
LKWIGTALAFALTIACALLASVGTAYGQEPRDPLIDPPAGGAESRFQVVGQRDWVPGETVRLRVGFAAADPLTFTGPFYFEQPVTVLRDGTWSFPIVVNEALLGQPPGATPGYIVVRAESGGRLAQNAYIYTVNGSRPSGADAIAPLGFGPGAPDGATALTLALFALGTGALVTLSGAWRYRDLRHPLR